MDLISLLVALAFGVAFAFFTPTFFAGVAERNESRGYPELQAWLPKIFKIGFWFCVLAACANLVALPFMKEEWSVALVGSITSAVLAWRFRSARQKEPIQPPVPTRGNGT
jgi:membrane associated rhomboid family serine protease